jgi:hypothetical protein
MRVCIGRDGRGQHGSCRILAPLPHPSAAPLVPTCGTRREERQWEEVSGGEEEGTGGGEDEGEELDEAVAMSSTSGRDELDESGVEELGDEDHDGEDEDGGEELDEAAAMTLTGGGDELDEARGRACGMRW